MYDRKFCLIREFTGNNLRILRRIVIRIQGAARGAYCTYSPFGATQNTDQKTSKMRRLFSGASLTLNTICTVSLSVKIAPKSYGPSYLDDGRTATSVNDILQRFKNFKKTAFFRRIETVAKSVRVLRDGAGRDIQAC